MNLKKSKENKQTYNNIKLFLHIFQDTEGTIRTIAKFLGKTLTDKEVELIKNYCSFERMKKNDMSNHSWFKTLGVSSQEGDFIRKGRVHKTDYSQKMEFTSICLPPQSGSEYILHMICMFSWETTCDFCSST